MASQKAENATCRVRLFPSTHKRLKIRAVKEGKTIAGLVDSLLRKS